MERGEESSDRNERREGGENRGTKSRRGGTYTIQVGFAVRKAFTATNASA